MEPTCGNIADRLVDGEDVLSPNLDFALLCILLETLNQFLPDRIVLAEVLRIEAIVLLLALFKEGLECGCYASHSTTKRTLLRCFHNDNVKQTRVMI